MQRTLEVKDMKIFVRTGTEGPKYDPYAFTEYTISRKDRVEIKLHMGLAEWLRIGKREWRGYSKEGLTKINQIMKRYCDLTQDDIDRLLEEKLEKCDKCGSTNVHSQPGYPGETLYICSDCKNIIDSSFDLSAIE